MKNNDFGNTQMHIDNANPAAHALSSCARANDLVAYLYNEATESEAKSFAAHLRECNACQAEFASFGGVRESVAAWRKESLGFSSSGAGQSKTAFVSETTMATGSRARSALAALREFFTISPAWMRAATALAAIAVCALAAMGVSNAEFNWNAGGISFRTHVAPVRTIEKIVPVEKLVKANPSEEELNAQVDERVRQRLAEMNLEQKQKQELVAGVITSAATVRKPVKRSTASQSTTLASVNPSVSPKVYNAVSPGAKRVEIADERDLPRLSDLLNDGSER